MKKSHREETKKPSTEKKKKIEYGFIEALF